MSSAKKSNKRLRSRLTICSTLQNGNSCMPEVHNSTGGSLAQFRLDGRVAFISGATGLLGKPMARAMAEAGAHVVLNARRKDALEDFASDLIAEGNHVSVACFDI